MNPIRKINILILFLLIGSSVLFAQEPYRMLDTPQPFTGVESQSGEDSQLTAIHIGLFSPDGTWNPAARAMIQGVSLSIEEANAEGGYHHIPFDIVRRWADDPWGAGSKEMIRMIYRDRVWAVIGSISGDSTHVAQQIVTKAYAVLVSPIVSDSSLTHINLPWIFRLPPDDRMQAEVLIGDGVMGQNLKKVGLLTSTDHDGRYVADELSKVMQEKNVPPVFHFTIAPNAEPLEEIVSRINDFQPDGLVARLPANRMFAFLTALKRSGSAIPIYLPWIPGLDVALLASNYSGSVTVIDPFAVPKHCGLYLKFVRAYIQRFGEKPDACAIYGYDAGRMIVEAIRKTGLKRSQLAKGLTDLSGFQGASGTIVWDNGGGNQAKPAIRVFPAH